MYNIKIYYIGFLSFFSTLVRSLQHFWMAALLWHSVSRIDSGLLMWHHCQRCSNATRPGFPCNNHGWKWESVSSSMRMTCFIQILSHVQHFVYLFFAWWGAEVPTFKGDFLATHNGCSAPMKQTGTNDQLVTVLPLKGKISVRQNRFPNASDFVTCPCSLTAVVLRFSVEVSGIWCKQLRPAEL